YRHLNFVSARNVTQMAVNDGVPHLILLSAAARPFGLPREYIESKRDAERHVQKSGLGWTILRASPMYAPGRRRNILYMALSLFRRLPLLGRLVAGYASTDVESVAQGIASLALSSNAFTNRMIGPTQLHRLGRTAARQRRRARVLPAVEPAQVDSDEPPFGWLPPVR
ncbi:MAG: NAD(P)H-binding protein, partial [Anaerolineae bacterium]|nr:NAD(P)H-binding protein [Anaerolineae bacterium]